MPSLYDSGIPDIYSGIKLFNISPYLKEIAVIELFIKQLRTHLVVKEFNSDLEYLNNKSNF